MVTPSGRISGAPSMGLFSVAFVSPKSGLTSERRQVGVIAQSGERLGRLDESPVVAVGRAQRNGAGAELVL